MKKLLMVALALAAVMLLAGAHKATSDEGMASAMSMEGYIIDTKCATDNKEDLAEFVKAHTKECALLPGCRASGYNIYSGGKLYKFDEGSSKKVGEFLDKKESVLHVKATVEHGEGDMVKLVSIENAV